MLTTLRIKNLALVADLTLELNSGYNVITGETGAGKSILIGALNLILGERADRTLIRAGTEACSVEAVFEVAKIRATLAEFLEENGLDPCSDGQLLLKRTFSQAGTNRQYINGSPASLSTLATLGEWLVDIHGPHDHQSLLHSARQLDILDAFGALSPLRSQLGELLRQRTALEAERKALVIDDKDFAAQLDLLRFQANEIKAAKLQAGEEVQVQEDFQRASNSARLLRLGQTILSLISQEENSILQQTALIGRTLQEIAKIDPGAAPLVPIHEQAVSALQELERGMAAYVERLETDPLRYQELEDRLNLIQTLKRKYGPTAAAIISFGEKAHEKLIQMEQRDAELIRLDQELEKLQSNLRPVAEKLSEQRRKLAPKLSKAVMKQLADLGFKQSRFEVIFATAQGELSSSGIDAIEFQFAPNPGEPAHPLRAIASSGELARVMLALKTVLAAEDQVPVLVFDEVDANVGGETARAVGEKMRQIARQRQVLCITHLAPVAAPADAHFVVTKTVEGGRTLSSIQTVQGNTRVTEVARMLGGQSDAARKHAEELLARP